VRHLPAVVGAMIVFWCLLSCQGPEWEDDPGVQATRRECAGFRKQAHFDCVLVRAVDGLNPAVCRLMSAGLDEVCLTHVFEAAGSAAICEEVYLAAVREECWSWYGTQPGKEP
jgi:hypothetical protein